MNRSVFLSLLASGCLVLLSVPVSGAVSPAGQAEVAEAPAAAPVCTTGLTLGGPPQFLLYGFDPGCIPSSCNKSCIIQGYDFGTCTGAGGGCQCRYYV